LKIVDASRLSARDTAELSIGLGEALYLEGDAELLDDRSGAAAELFQTAMMQSSVLDPETRPPLRAGPTRSIARHTDKTPDSKPIYQRLLIGAEQGAPARSAIGGRDVLACRAARGTGDLDRAIAAAAAGDQRAAFWWRERQAPRRSRSPGASDDPSRARDEVDA
jgi:hypothetical protein